MKHILFKKTILLVVGLLLIVLFWLLFQDYFRSTLIAQPYKTQRSTGTTPTLKSINKFDIQIFRNTLISSNGAPFIFRGVSTNFFRGSQANEYIETVEDLISYMEQIHGWGANSFQLYLRPQRFDVHGWERDVLMHQIKQVIEWGEVQGVWIILNPVSDVTWELGVPVRDIESIVIRDNMANFLSEIAKAFSHYPNVVFGIEAEPKFIDTISTIYERVDAIRKYSDKPILIPAVNFSGSLEIIPAIKNELALENIIIDYHPYTGSSIKEPGEFDEIVQLDQLYIDTDVYDAYPVMFGEFGGFYEKDFNSVEDITYMTQIGQLAKKTQISFMAYAIDDYLMPLFDESGRINDRGKAVKFLLQSN